MPFLPSEQGIGRGELAESRLEAPLFALFAALCAVALFAFHFAVQSQSLTIAVAVSMLVFGLTLVRVEIGLYILVVAMLLSPEVRAGTVGGHGELDVNLRYDDVLIMVIFLGILVKLAYEGKAALWRSNPINPAIVAYYGVCLVSTLDALRINVPAWDASVAFFVLLKMLQFYLVFWMVGVTITRPDEIKRQLVVFFSVALIVSGYGIYSIGKLDRVSAPFDVAGGTEPNTLGGYLLLVMCVALGLLLYAPRMRTKLLLAAFCTFAIVPFTMTLSRASYASLVVALAAMAVLGRRWAMLAGLALVLLASPLFLPDDVINRVMYTFTHGGGEVVSVGSKEILLDSSTYERIYVWEKVKFNLTVWPWLGGGVSWETVLDSQYARVLIETGLFGFAAFLFLLWRLFRTTHQTYRWSRDWIGRGLGLGLAAATVGLIVHGLGTISFLIVRIMEPFWFLVALAIIHRDFALKDYAQRVQAWKAKEQSASTWKVRGRV